MRTRIRALPGYLSTISRRFATQAVISGTVMIVLHAAGGGAGLYKTIFGPGEPSASSSDTVEVEPSTGRTSIRRSRPGSRSPSAPPRHPRIRDRRSKHEARRARREDICCCCGPGTTDPLDGGRTKDERGKAWNSRLPAMVSPLVVEGEKEMIHTPNAFLFKGNGGRREALLKGDIA